MKRRTLVLGTGALASGSIAAIGTGAFTTIDADRDADVRVVNDSEAYLRLEPTDDYFDQDWMPYATTDTASGAIEFSFDDEIDGVDGGGVATDSTYVFLGRPAGPDAEGNYTSMFVVENRGPTDVTVSQPDDVESDAEVRMIVEELTWDGELTGEINDLVEDQSVYVPSGEAVGLGIRIDTTGVEEPFADTVSIPITAEEYEIDEFGTEAADSGAVRGPSPNRPE